MKYKLLLFFVSLYIWLAIFVGESSGIVRNEKTSEYTVDAVNQYLEQHKLSCSDIICDNTLIKTVLSYKEAVDAAAGQLGSKASSVKPFVKDSLKSVQNDIEKLIEDVKHQIYQLRLKGRLTNDKVKQILDKAHNEVLQKKIMTEYEWKTVCQSLWSMYKPSKWYKKAFKSKPAVSQITTLKLDDLLQTVSQHINSLGILPESQNTNIINLIRESIENKEYGKWTMTEWIDFLSSSIEKKTGLNKETLYQVIESIKDSLIEFKLKESYSSQILHNGLEQTLYWFIGELKNSTCTIKETVLHVDHAVKNTSMWFNRMVHSSRWLMFVKKDLITLYNNIKITLGQMEYNISQSLHSHQQQEDNRPVDDHQQIKATSTLILGYPEIKLSSPTSSTLKNSKIAKTTLTNKVLDTDTTTTTSDQGQDSSTKSASDFTLTDYEASIQTVYPVSTKVSEAVLYSKTKLFDSEFVEPWKENDQDIYRSLGYSETHVEWIKSYLERHFRNKKATACGDINEAAQVIKRYLSNIKIQSPSQIEKTIEILRKHLYRWRVSCDN